MNNTSSLLRTAALASTLLVLTSLSLAAADSPKPKVQPTETTSFEMNKNLSKHLSK
jgi:hypothetical protein